VSIVSNKTVASVARLQHAGDAADVSLGLVDLASDCPSSDWEKLNIHVAFDRTGRMMPQRSRSSGGHVCDVTRIAGTCAVFG
jgi:hypothetical protein